MAPTLLLQMASEGQRTESKQRYAENLR